MIRTVSRVASFVSRSHVAAIRAPVAVQLARSFATTSDLVSTGGQAAPPANFRTVKHQLARMLDEDASELATQPDEGLIDYIKENKLKIVTEKNGEIKMTRTVGDYRVTVSFVAESDEDQNERDENEAPEESEESEQSGQTTVEGEEGSQPEDYELPPHSFEIEIENTSAKKSTTIRVTAAASKHGEFVIDSILLDAETIPKEEPVEASSPLSMPFEPNDVNRLDVADLSEAGQEKFLEFIESIGIDDKMAQFIQHYTQVVRTQQYLDKIRKFKAFLSN